jgi:hypothetical protein
LKDDPAKTQEIKEQKRRMAGVNIKKQKKKIIKSKDTLLPKFKKTPFMMNPMSR